jgi:hypothetical protein
MHDDGSGKTLTIHLSLGMCHPTIPDIGGTTRGLIHYIRQQPERRCTQVHPTDHNVGTDPDPDDDPSSPWILIVKSCHDLIANMIAHPNENRYRIIQVASPGFMSKIGTIPGGIEFFLAQGYHETSDGTLAFQDLLDTAKHSDALRFLSARQLELQVGLVHLETTRRYRVIKIYIDLSIWIYIYMYIWMPQPLECCMEYTMKKQS